MKQSNLLNAQFARRLFRTAFSSWQLLAVMLIVCMNVAVGSKLYAQSNTIAVKGKVMADGEPVIGATVLVKGVSTGTATDMDGNFSLNVASKAVLVVSSIGYETQEVPVNGRQFINVVLKSDVVALKDVVVVGYGVQKKVNLTGAVSSVSTDELEGKPISNVLEAMQGTTPGLVIQQGSSTPGSVPSINIRGLNTMNNNDPLVIIDGIEGSLANLNPADIEQISILKDASSTAIYGSRASNGVVLVTTKKGKAGKVEISYDFMYGVQQPTSLPKIADSWVYAELYNEAAVNSGRAAKFTPEQIAQYRNGGPNVNWVKELYNRNSPQSSHNVSMTGGNDQLSYMASLGYLDQSSMFKGPDYGYKRYNARLNVSHKVTNNFTLNLTSQFARNDIKEHAYWTEWIIEQANRMPPIYPIKNEDGSYNYPAGSNSNGLQRLEEGGYRQNVNDELLGTIQAEWEVYKGLKLIGSAGGRVWNNKLHENRKAFEGTGDTENKLTEQFYRSKNITTNLMVTYNTKIGKHSIGGLLGYAYEGFSEKQFSTSRLTEDSKYDIFVGDLSGDKVSNTGSGSDWAITDKATYQDEQYQNQLDAETIYFLLEHNILPLYYERKEKDYPETWVKYIKNSVAQIAPRFTMKRQLDDYYDGFYNKLSEHFHVLAADNYAKAKTLAGWKAAVDSRWNAVEIVSVNAGKGLDATVEAGKEYEMTVVIDEKGLDNAIGLESVIIRHEENEDRIHEVIPFSLTSKDGNLYTFKAITRMFSAGSFKQAFRMYPNHPLLPHRQDFCYVRWF